MNDSYETAATAIRQLQDHPPAEPFANRKRRPNNFRYMPEYRKWEADLRDWQERYACLLRSGLQTIYEPGTAGVSFYGDSITSACFAQQADGSIIWDGRPAADAHPLELPGLRQSTLRFQQANREQWRSPRKWDLRSRFGQYLRDAGLHPDQSIGPGKTRDHESFAGPIRTQISDNLENLELNLIRQASALLLLEPQRLLQQAAPGLKPNLRHYNLAAMATDALRHTATTNPGAAAWFICLYGDPDYGCGDGNPPTFPSHPGEIITFVRAQFEAAGGLRWRMLAAQPAKDVITQLQTHGVQQTALMANVLADAAIPKLDSPPAKPAKKPKPPARQGTLFDSPPPPTPPAPTPPIRTAVRYRQPPLPLKTALLELCERGPGVINRARRRRNLGLSENRRHILPDDIQPLERALLRFCRLAIRQFGGEPPPQGNETHAQRSYVSRLANIADFVHADPESAARCTTWNGLVKASNRWHRDAVIRAIAEAERRTQEDEAMAKTPWPSVIDRHQATGWHARALVTAVELSLESIVLNHCVGGGFYATLCREGRCGIFRVQPDGIADDDINGQRQFATTLEIGKDQSGWYVRQHKGYRNRRVSSEEDARAQELLAAWKRAIQQPEATTE